MTFKDLLVYLDGWTRCEVTMQVAAHIAQRFGARLNGLHVMGLVVPSQLGLDLTRFHADMQSQKTTDRIAKDRKLGEDLQIQGTPTIYINGREYTDPKDTDSLREWIKEELAK